MYKFTNLFDMHCCMKRLHNSIDNEIIFHTKQSDYVNCSTLFFVCSIDKYLAIPNLRDVVAVDTDISSDKRSMKTVIDGGIVERTRLSFLHVVVERDDIEFLKISFCNFNKRLVCNDK